MGHEVEKIKEYEVANFKVLSRNISRGKTTLHFTKESGC